MKLNENTIKGKWLEMKGELQKSWGKLTDNELDQTKGDMKAIGGLIQQRYGEAQNTYGKKLSAIFQKHEANKNKIADEIKAALKN